MSKKRIDIMVTEYTFFVFFILIIFDPLLIPDYPIGVIESLFAVDALTDAFSLVIMFIGLGLLAMDFFLIILIKNGRLFARFPESFRKLYTFALTISPFIFALTLDFLVWLGMNAYPKIIFCAIGLGMYIYVKFF